jgi:hypothetical protein
MDVLNAAAYIAFILPTVLAVLSWVFGTRSRRNNPDWQDSPSDLEVWQEQNADLE